jgi:hypothetical protein
MKQTIIGLKIKHVEKIAIFQRKLYKVWFGVGVPKTNSNSIIVVN